MIGKEKKYAVQGMQIKCSMGTTMCNLNTDVGHGFTYQGKPVLNANDHMPLVNMTTFGMCGNKPCVLTTPLAWRLCNDEYMIDGAPALTTDSVCPCALGGIISIVDSAISATEQTVDNKDSENEKNKSESDKLKKRINKVVGANKGIPNKLQFFRDMIYINKYVNEETLMKINSNRWGINQKDENGVVIYPAIENLKKNCGTDVFERLRLNMYQAGITDEKSILMFLSTIGVESDYGNSILEYEYSSYSSKTYVSHTRGAGLIQITGSSQKLFLQYINTKIQNGEVIVKEDIKSEIQNYINGFQSVKISNGETQTINNYGNAAQFIADNFAVESSVWYWGINERCMKYDTKEADNHLGYISINEYIETLGDCNEDNVFLVVQYYVNRQRWRDPNPWKMCYSDTVLTPYIKSYTNDNGELKQDYFVDFAQIDALAPGHWAERKGDWDEAKKLLEKTE